MTDLERLYAANAAALEHWTTYAAIAENYLNARGISLASIANTYRIGYPPPGWTTLIDHMRKRGFRDTELLKSGLAIHTKNGHLVDRFRNRVMFPIRTDDGTIAGFTGRHLGNSADMPKYLNTPATDIFNKSALLYGLHEGRRGQPVLVEGPTDVLALAARRQGQDLLPVATCGTALTQQHAANLAAWCREHGTQPVIAYDSDTAGQTAALKAGELLRTRGLQPTIAALPAGRDPADHLAAGGSLAPFRNAIPLPAAMAHKIINDYQRHWNPTWPETKIGITRAIANYTNTYPPEQRPTAAGQAFTIARARAGISADTIAHAAEQRIMETLAP